MGFNDDTYGPDYSGYLLDILVEIKETKYLLTRIARLLEDRAKNTDFILCGNDIVDAISATTIEPDPTVTETLTLSTPTY